MQTEKRLVALAKTAMIWADQSTCVRLHVGAVIFNKRTFRVLSIGYNGTVPGAVHHCTDLFDKNNLMVHIDIQEYLKPDFELSNISGWSKVTEQQFRQLHHQFSELYEVHAEQNAIYNLLKTGTHWQAEDLAIVVTHEPCCQCMKALLALGIKEIYFVNKYDNQVHYKPMIDIKLRRIEWQ
jgi:deoxycytidylate deaminase